MSDHDLQGRLKAAGVEDVPPEEVRRALLAETYRKHLLRMPQYQYVESAGIAALERVVALRLEDAYVDLEVVPRERAPAPEREERELLDTLARGEIAEEERDEAERRLAERGLAGRRAEARRIGIPEVLRRHRHVVILGDPGAGKTTLVRYLTQTYARGPEAVQERLGLEEDLLPLVAPAAAFAKARQEDSSLSLWRFIAREAEELECDDRCVQLALAAMEAGRAIVLIDGLDEIPDAQERRNVALRAQQLLARFAQCRVVITTRIIGYAISQVPGPEQFQLVPFSDDQVREFAQKWWHAFERSLHPEAPDDAAAERQAEALTDTIFENPSVLDLARNPLMVALVAVVQHQEGSLPDRRAELYEKALRTLIETWNKRRSLAAVELALPEGARLDYYDTCNLWAPIAFWMHETQPTAGVHTAELRRRLVEQLEGRALDGKTIEATADSYIEAAGRHTGLLRARGENMWSFFHQTFQEYLAAQHMAREPFELLSQIDQRMLDPRWHEVIRLAVGYVGVIQRMDGLATRVLEQLLERGDDQVRDESSLERFTYQHLFLVASCIADGPRVSSDLENEVTCRLFDAAEQVDHTPAQHAIGDALGAMDHVVPQGEALHRARSLVLNSGGADVRMAAAGLLRQSPRDEALIHALLAEVRRGALVAAHGAGWALVSIVRRDDLPLLTELAADEDDNVQSYATSAMADIVSRDDLDLLTRLARDPDSRVRHFAAAGLVEVVSSEDLELIGRLLRDQDAQVRYPAAEALGNIASPDHLDLLRGLAADTDWRVRTHAAEGLGNVGTHDALELLMQLAKDETSDVYYAAAQALANIVTRDDLAVVMQLAAEDDPRLCYAAARAVGSVATRQDIRLVRQLARDEVSDVRWAAAQALASIVTPDDLELLAQLATDHGPDVRYAAAEALGNIVTRDGLALLTRLATDEDPDVRYRAATALGSVVTRENVRLLTVLARDSQVAVRDAAARALAKIVDAHESVAMYEAAGDERERETYAMAIWYSVHGAE